MATNAFPNNETTNKNTDKNRDTDTNNIQGTVHTVTEVYGASTEPQLSTSKIPTAKKNTDGEYTFSSSNNSSIISSSNSLLSR